MTQHMHPYLFESEHLVRSVMISDEPWFVGADAARLLGIKDHHQALQKLDDDERGRYSIPTPQGVQEMIIISEAGFYRLVFASNKPIAQRVKRWLAHDVIPSIRKTGSYNSLTGDISSPTPAEHRPFPDWPLEEMRTKRGVVDMYRMLYGCMAAQWVSPQMGFPSPPLELVEHGRQYTMTLVPQQGVSA